MYSNRNLFHKHSTAVYALVLWVVTVVDSQPIYMMGLCVGVVVYN